MAYFEGEGSKFISSTGDQTVDMGKLCVDGGASYSGPIQLYDDGTHGDDFAGDNIFTRECVHFCTVDINFDDYFGFAMEEKINNARLIVVDASLKGTVPYEAVDTPLTPDTKAIASSHAFFFADVNRRYHPDFPKSLSPNGAAGPSGKSVAVSALLQVFGDVFDLVTVTPLVRSNAIGGAGIYKWQHWDRRGGVMINQNVGRIDKCSIAVSGVPIHRLTGVVTNGDVVSGDEFNGQLHELVHGVSGYSYNGPLQKARNGDNMHIPGSCTFDHSSLQGPVWDWVEGYPIGITATDGSRRGVRLVENEDCEDCDDGELENCCSFKYMKTPVTKAELMFNPELMTMSPFMLYIAGMIGFDEIPNDKKTYYCFGSDTDGGCGSQESQKPCVNTVDDSDRSAVTSNYTERFTAKELVNANGGKRFPEKKFNTVRHAAIHISSREPTEAEIVFYTILWRHHETETEPWERINNKHPIQPWSFHTSGKSILHSRLHGIECGPGGSSPSCDQSSDDEVCDGHPCGPGAICMNMDGKPFCMCVDGTVGDGIECAFPSETSYATLPSAHDLLNSDEKCFAQDDVWTNFVLEESLPSYPGGQSPYSPTSCGSKVCSVGGICNAKNKCKAPKSKSMCEGNQGITRGKCEALGCCKWKKGECRKNGNECQKPSDPNVFNCPDINTCCYFDCKYLTLDHNGAQLGQVGNCGYDCTSGIAADTNGVVHPELYLWPEKYIENGKFYDYDIGPLDVQGADKNMFDRCYNKCFDPVNDNADDKYIHKIKNDDRMLLKTCDYLSKQSEKKKKKYCSDNHFNLSTRGYFSARIACPKTCSPYTIGMNVEVIDEEKIRKPLNMSKIYEY
eukprot:CAMPEP_0194353762 /NCGR_PEP_ID=MMETSP0174-20130528/2011_1 /TAXON_ID=216777 /ORGANISM="Proboscia alata, Strain PI-D3" /LENGTH=847 /DNA_ID=CAMNT_0039122437 /DNA_START=193 /DNA_END=2736 /DNA_ORIENTATION=+